MVKIILLALLCLLTFISCKENSYKIPLGESDSVYSWQSEDGNMEYTASVELYEGGKFTMVFSPISSYIGVGDYTITNDKLILETDDGDYTYTFDISDEGLVFDSENSSDFTWFAGFEDGAIFTKTETLNK